MKMRDNFWLWGHPEGRFNELEGYKEALEEKKSRMTPMEACLYLGVKNTFMIPMGVPLDRRQYNKSFTTLRQVGWDTYKAATDPSALDTFIEDAKEFKNISCVVFDDFQRENKYKEMKIEDLNECQRRLKEDGVRPLDMWMVLYTNEFGLDKEKDEDFKRYIEPFDGIIMWTWKESDVPLIPEKWELFKAMTPKNRRMFGCYLWNFGECKQATAKAVKWQLDFYREQILKGEAEGVVLHTNTMADLDYEAYDAAIEWMNEHGDEEIPFN